MNTKKRITHYAKSVEGFGLFKIESVHVTKNWHLTLQRVGKKPWDQLQKFDSAEECAAYAADHLSSALSLDSARLIPKEVSRLSSWDRHEEKVEGSE